MTHASAISMEEHSAMIILDVSDTKQRNRLGVRNHFWRCEQQICSRSKRVARKGTGAILSAKHDHLDRRGRQYVECHYLLFISKSPIKLLLQVSDFCCLILALALEVTSCSLVLMQLLLAAAELSFKLGNLGISLISLLC